MSGSSGVAGHLVDLEAETIAPDPAYMGPFRYIVADAPGRIGIDNCGQFANDLGVAAGVGRGDGGGAGGAAGDGVKVAGEGTYASVADERNLLAIKHQLRVEEAGDSRMLVPMAPRFCLRRSVSFVSSEPMEVGCTYGEQFWRSKLS